jgi:hypothetical protein
MYMKNGKFPSHQYRRYHMTHDTGIYKLTHLPTGKYYIGSTTNLSQRFHLHLTHMKRGTAQRNLLSLWNNDKDEWTISFLKKCSHDELASLEHKYLTRHMARSECVNINTTQYRGGRQDVAPDVTRYRMADGMLGKNRKDQTVKRPPIVNLVAPDGTVYHDVRSINRFCIEHNLSQSGINGLVNNDYDVYSGWTLQDAPLPRVSKVFDYWPMERIARHYQKYTVVGPDGAEYETYNLHKFQQDHQCTVLRTTPTLSTRSSIRGINQYGQGYRLKDVPTFTVTYQGHTYSNVLSLGALRATLGISAHKMAGAYMGRRTNNPRVTVCLEHQNSNYLI